MSPVPEFTDSGVNFKALMHSIFRSGASIAYTGNRGGGKTHHCIANNEYMLHTRPRTVLLTNVIFLRYRGYKERMFGDECRRVPDFEGHKYPPNVLHVTTMEEVFRLTGKLLDDDPDTLILIALDEAQNFILADIREDLILTFYRYGANTRKFRHCQQFLTPSLANLPPRLRTFNDDPRSKGGGYLDCHFYKSRYEVDEYNRAWGTRFTPKEMTLIKISFDHRAELMESPVSRWTKPWNMLKPGNYVYDHLASAIFRLGNFNFDDLVLEIGDTPSMDVPSAILDFFDNQDAEAPKDDEEADDLALAKEIIRARKVGVKWEDLATIKGMPRSTLQTIAGRYPDLAMTEAV